MTKSKSHGNARAVKARAYARMHDVKYTEALRVVDAAHRYSAAQALVVPWVARARGLEDGVAYDPALVCVEETPPGEIVVGGPGSGKSALALDAVLRTALLDDVTQVVFDDRGDAARAFGQAADLGLDPARVKILDLREAVRPESATEADDRDDLATGLILAGPALTPWPTLSRGDLLVVVPPWRTPDGRQGHVRTAGERAAEVMWSTTLRRAAELLTALPREWSKVLTVDALPFDCPASTMDLVGRLARTGRSSNLYLRCVCADPSESLLMNVGAVWVGRLQNDEDHFRLTRHGLDSEHSLIRTLRLGEFLLRSWGTPSGEMRRVEAVVDPGLLANLRHRVTTGSARE